MTLLDAIQAVATEATAVLTQLTERDATIEALQAANATQNGKIAELEGTVSAQAIALEEMTRQRDHAVEWGKQVAAEFEAHLKTHQPAVPPVVVSMQVAGAAQPTAYSLTPAHAEAPFRGTGRFELPLADGLVFVLLDTPRHGHASYIVERRKAGVFGAALPLLDYTVTIVDPRYGFEATETVTGHGQWQRWRKQNKPWPRGEFDPRLAFAVDPRNKPGATVNAVPSVPEPTPLFTAGLKIAMGTTGLRNDIGTHTAWLAKAIRTGDWGDALRSAEAAASIPWHVRDDAGKLVILTGPENLKRMTRTNYASPIAIENMIDENVGWILDQAHAPKVAWTGRVACSQDTDPYWIEELQFEAAAMINQTHPDRKGPDGLLITNDQGRDWTWGMVSLVHALSVTPEEVPDWLIPRSTWQAIIDANLAPILPLVGTTKFDRVSVRAGNYDGRSAKGAFSEQTFTIDYVPQAMLHCHRLTGDERFKTIGVAHMDARIAKRWKASPKYAFLFAPVSVGDGTTAQFFTSWDAAYKARGWVSDESTPWSSFLRPTGSEVDALDGKALMTYADPFLAYYLFVADLYVREGWGTPDIAWLAGFLEGKRGKAVINLVEQLAVA